MPFRWFAPGFSNRGVKADLSEVIHAAKATIKAGKLPTIPGNKTQLQHLFQNLITNAIKFQPPRQAPVIAIKSSPATAEEIAHLGLNTGTRYAKVTLADNGIGFDDTYNQKSSRSFSGCMPAPSMKAPAMDLPFAER